MNCSLGMTEDVRLDEGDGSSRHVELDSKSTRPQKRMIASAFVRARNQQQRPKLVTLLGNCARYPTSSTAEPGEKRVFPAFFGIATGRDRQLRARASTSKSVGWDRTPGSAVALGEGGNETETMRRSTPFSAF